VHEVVSNDYYANGDIANHSGDEYEHVDDSDWQHDVQRKVLRPSGPEQITLYRLVCGVFELDHVRSTRRVVHVKCIVDTAP